MDPAAALKADLACDLIKIQLSSILESIFSPIISLGGKVKLLLVQADQKDSMGDDQIKLKKLWTRRAF